MGPYCQQIALKIRTYLTKNIQCLEYFNTKSYSSFYFFYIKEKCKKPSSPPQMINRTNELKFEEKSNMVNLNKNKFENEWNTNEKKKKSLKTGMEQYGGKDERPLIFSLDVESTEETSKPKENCT